MSAIQKNTYKIMVSNDEDDGRFIGWCDELRACSFGDTFGELMENMKEAVELAVEELNHDMEFNMLVIKQ